MGKFVPSHELPNKPLLELITGMQELGYKGYPNNLEMRQSIKYDINLLVQGLIREGLWLTRSINGGRFIKFIEVDVLTIDNMPNDVKIVQVWEYEEDIYGEDSESPDQGHLEDTGWITPRN